MSDIDDDHDALAWLVSQLGTELVGSITGHEAPDVVAWLSGADTPPPDALDLLGTAGAVTALLLVDEMPQLARTWWFTPNTRLADLEPWEAIALDPDGVLAAARAFTADDCPGCLR